MGFDVWDEAHRVAARAFSASRPAPRAWAFHAKAHERQKADFRCFGGQVVHIHLLSGWEFRMLSPRSSCWCASLRLGPSMARSRGGAGFELFSRIAVLHDAERPG